MLPLGDKIPQLVAITFYTVDYGMRVLPPYMQ